MKPVTKWYAWLVLVVVTIGGCTPPLTSELIDSKGVSMRLIPAGEFTMGSDDDNDSRNQSHSVYLDAFYMDVYEVTNASYAECVAAHACEPPHYARTDFRPAYFGDSHYDDFPVIYVDWTMAGTYCEWRNARLPTEAEWEKAARGTDKRSYPWGEGISCAQANFDGDPDDPATFCVGDTSKVGSYESGMSPYGLYDMAGNVFEWVSSLNKPYPYDALDGREDPMQRGSRVIRGGSWNEGPNDQQVFYRSWLDPALSESAIGFRCAKDAP